LSEQIFQKSVLENDRIYNFFVVVGFSLPAADLFNSSFFDFNTL